MALTSGQRPSILGITRVNGAEASCSSTYANCMFGYVFALYKVNNASEFL